MGELLERINRVVWGVPSILLIVGVGVYLSVRTRFIQVTFFPKAVKVFAKRLLVRETSNNGTSGFQALCTALAATVGTGNLAGVAGAIALGGPGAVFWMWVCAFLGMVVKFSEAVLSVRYRTIDENGEIYAGPMFMIQRGMSKRWHWLAGLYCFFGVVAAFGVGNTTQINAVIGGINSVIQLYGGQEFVMVNLIMGLILAVIVALMLLGGVGKIGKIAERLVPFAAVFYILLSLGVLIIRRTWIPEAFRCILRGAFAPKAVTGGVVGSCIQAVRAGASRGVFTNEAGLGTAGIAHGAAQVDHPVEQGMMGIIEVFIDTIVICTMTALVVLCSGVTLPYGLDSGMQITSNAFSAVYGRWISIPIALALCLFAVATVLGWGLYGVRCAQFLFGKRVWRLFVWLQIITVVLGSVLKTGTVWLLAETVNGLMMIPNLIALLALSRELIRLTKEYKKGVPL